MLGTLWKQRQLSRPACCAKFWATHSALFKSIPAWLNWNDGTVQKVALAIYNERAFDRMPILADALEEAGCTNADILNHFRLQREHVQGCWVVNMILGKE